MKCFHHALVQLLVSWAIVADSAAALITIDTVLVGNVGNANDPATGYGAVSSDYRIGKYEVTLNQYTAFLNAVGATDPYSLYHANMAANLNIAGIARSGASGAYTYSVIGSGARPVTYVSWFDAARFANWMHNGQPTGAQTAGTTETGAYTLNGALSGTGFMRTLNATYGLPSENEWYKAAYHQPASQGGDSDNYWRFPTANNAVPNSRNGSASDPNSANYYRDGGIGNGVNGGFAVSQSQFYSPSQQYLTVVGAFSLASSFYGTFDQGGNVYEWNDSVNGTTHGLRSSSWSGGVNLDATSRNGVGPTGESDISGFRITFIPEPGVTSIMVLGTVVLARLRKRTLYCRRYGGNR